MRKICLIVSTLLISTSALALGADPNYKSPRQFWSEAESAQSQKDYALAITNYNKAIAVGYVNSSELYELACAYALHGQPDDALTALEKSAASGFRLSAQLQTDSDLSSLHNDLRWKAISARVTENAATYHASHGDPEKFKIITSDIDLFWQVYDQLPSQPDPAAFLEHQYLDRGSPGLQGFILHRIQSGEKLNRAIQAEPKFYASIRNNTLRMAALEPQIRAAMRKFKALYDDANFPDVYFVIGRFSSGGTSNTDGLIMGTEIFSAGPDVPLDELDDWQRAVIKNTNQVPSIVAHELMHFQQNYNTSTAFAGVIKEGAADFLGSLVSDGNFNEHIYKYGYAHEAELKTQFLQDMAKDDSTNWLYHTSQSKDRPADLGYFMGFRITQAYYQRAVDKKQAVIDILNIKDFDRFVRDSGYFSEKQ